MIMQAVVAEFMSRAGMLDETGVDVEALVLHKLVAEEFDELVEAGAERDEIEFDDALIDLAFSSLALLYKRRGTQLGNAMITEVCRANMDKVDPIEDIVYYPGTNKVGKPVGWRAPEHARLIKEHDDGKTYPTHPTTPVVLIR